MKDIFWEKVASPSFLLPQSHSPILSSPFPPILSDNLQSLISGVIIPMFLFHQEADNVYVFLRPFICERYHTIDRFLNFAFYT